MRWYNIVLIRSPNLVLIHNPKFKSRTNGSMLIPCLTPSNVLPFYVTAETGSAECPGFAALSTLLEVKSKGVSYNKLYKKNPLIICFSVYKAKGNFGLLLLTFILPIFVNFIINT